MTRTSEEIKSRFGKLFKAEREKLRSRSLKKDGSKVNRNMSRREMAEILNVSPKTIQSWEMGRTFIDKLLLIPKIYYAFGIEVTALVYEATYGESVL